MLIEKDGNAWKVTDVELVNALSPVENHRTTGAHFSTTPTAFSIKREEWVKQKCYSPWAERAVIMQRIDFTVRATIS